jgi:hypothetical protein
MKSFVFFSAIKRLTPKDIFRSVCPLDVVGDFYPYSLRAKKFCS